MINISADCTSSNFKDVAYVKPSSIEAKLNDGFSVNATCYLRFASLKTKRFTSSY